jgi:hypothetical protein
MVCHKLIQFFGHRRIERSAPSLYMRQPDSGFSAAIEPARVLFVSQRTATM